MSLFTMTKGLWSQKSATFFMAPAVPKMTGSWRVMTGIVYFCRARKVSIRSYKWCVLIIISVQPARWSFQIMVSRIGRSAIVNSGLGVLSVYGSSRVPNPAARMRAFISLVSSLRSQLEWWNDGMVENWSSNIPLCHHSNASESRINKKNYIFWSC